jgi:hypothetical protein
MQLKFKDGSLDLPDSPRPASRVLADLFYNSGRQVDSDERIKWGDLYGQNFSRKARIMHSDAVGAPDLHPLLQSSLEIILREPVEPLIVINRLFTQIESQGLLTEVLAGSIGAVEATDIPEHGTYPEVMIQIGGGMQTATIGKSGIAASFTDEALRYTSWDMMGLLMRQMGAALVRHKEQKAVNLLRAVGTELFNNANPATSLFGVTTGRGLDMAANGSMRMEDLMWGMAHMAEEGFPPDIILVNPLFFYMFLLDPVLREMMLAHGGGAYFNPWNGQPGPLDPWSNGSMGGRGPTLGNRISRTVLPNGQTSPGGTASTGLAGREHGMTATFNLPGYFPWSMSVIVSPFVPFDPSTNLGDVYLLSSGNVGYEIVDERPVSVEWRDEDVEVVKMKIRERYSHAVAHEGMGVGVMKNVKLTRNYWDGTIQAMTMDIDSEISPDTSIML